MRNEEIAGLIALMIPMTAIVLGIGLGFWGVYWGHQRKRLQYQERQLMIEKGLVPPPELLEDDRKRVTPEDCLRRGTILLSLGIGLALATVFLGSFDRGQDLVRVAGVAAAIVGSLGTGNLAYYFIARKKPDDEQRMA